MYQESKLFGYTFKLAYRRLFLSPVLLLKTERAAANRLKPMDLFIVGQMYTVYHNRQKNKKKKTTTNKNKNKQTNKPTK